MEAAEREQADIVASGMYVDEPVRPWVWRNGIQQGVYKGKSLHRFYSKMIFSSEDTHGIILGMVCKIYRTQLLLKNLETIDPRIYYGEDAACVFFVLSGCEVHCYAGCMLVSLCHKRYIRFRKKR